MNEEVIEWIEEKRNEGIEEDVIKEALMKKRYTEEESDKLLNNASDNNGNGEFVDNNYDKRNFSNSLKQLPLSRVKFISILVLSIISISLISQLFYYQPASCNINYSFNEVDYDGEDISLDWNMSTSGKHQMRVRSIFLEKGGDQSIFVSNEELRKVTDNEKNFDDELDVGFVKGNYELSSVSISLSDCNKAVNVNFERLPGDFDGNFTEDDYSINTTEY